MECCVLHHQGRVHFPHTFCPSIPADMAEEEVRKKLSHVKDYGEKTHKLDDLDTQPQSPE